MSEQTHEEVKDPGAVLAELRRVQEDLKAIRKERDELVAAKESLEAQVNDDQWRTRALNAELKAHLTDKGIKDVERVLKYVKADDMDFDENGKLTGFEDKYKEWQKDLPEVFDSKRRAGGKADIFADSVAEPKEDPLRAQVRNALAG